VHFNAPHSRHCSLNRPCIEHHLTRPLEADALPISSRFATKERFMTNSIRTNKTETATTAARWALGLVGAFLALLALLHVAEPEFDPSWRFISEYALGSFGFALMLGFFALALSCVAVVVAVRSQIRGNAGKIGLGLLLVALALAAAGVFPQDPVTARPDELTLHGSLHGFAAMIGLPGFAIAALLISVNLTRHHQAWTTARGRLLWSANLTWISLVAMIVYLALNVPQAGGFGPSVLAGWFNRLVVLTQCVWLIFIAQHALKVSKQRA
jgi:Protein of unknown function (DUF998)